MHAALAVATLFAVLPTAATPAPRPLPLPVPSSSDPAEAAAAPAGAPLFTLLEKTDSGDVVAWPDDASLVDVDINSAIAIDLRAPTSTASNDEMLARLKSLRALHESTAQAVAGLLDVDRRRAQLADAPAPSADEAAALAQLESTSATAMLGAIDALKAYLRATGKTEASVESELDAIFNQVGYDALLEFLVDEDRRVSRALSGSSDTLTVEIVALIGANGERLHVPGYDDLSPGAARVVDKLRFDTAKLDDEYQLAQDITRKATHLRGLQEEMRALVQKAVADVAARLAPLQSRLQAAKVRITTSGAAATPSTAAWLSAARAAFDSCDAAAGAAVRLRATLAGADDDAGDELVRSLLPDFQSVVERGPACAAGVDDVVRTAPSDAAALVDSELRALAQELAGLLRLLPASAKLARTAGARDVRGVDVDIVVAQDATISLITANRDDNDIITIIARLKRGGRVVEELARQLRVVRNGFVADVGAAVLMQQTGTLDGPWSVFTPAPAAYAVVRFRGWRGDGDAGSPFFRLVAPGVGVGSAGIIKPDGSTQVALMLTGHLFGDVLQVGFGVTSSRDLFWGVGLGLHQLAGIGIDIN